MARDVYEFDESDVSNNLAAIGKSILQSGKSKDALIKLLKVSQQDLLNNVADREPIPPPLFISEFVLQCVMNGTASKLCDFCLQQASNYLEHAEQGSDSHLHAAADLSKAFVQKQVIGHKDKVHFMTCHMSNPATER